MEKSNRVVHMTNLMDTQYIIHDCERQLLAELDIGDYSHFNIQSLQMHDMLNMFQRIVEPYRHKIESYILKLLEDLIIFLYDLNRSSSYVDYSMSVVTFIKLRTGSSLIMDISKNPLMTYFKEIFSEDEREVQSIEKAKGFLNNLRAVRESALANKIKKLCTHNIISTIMEKLGQPYEGNFIKEFISRISTLPMWSSTDFILNLIEISIVVVERGQLFYETRDWSVFTHSDIAYSTWSKKCSKLKIQSQQLNDPQFFGFSESSYIADLEEAIEMGKAIGKFSYKLNPFEKNLVKSSLSELQFKHCEILTSRRARENRKAPFSILIDGDSSIGKSTITNMLFQHFGKLYNLPTGDEFKYTKNPVAKYWDGFRTSMWCLQLDDISYMHPNKASEGDPSVMEIIQVVNNVPYVPDQAALENKGKTPLRCDLCIATTNTEHLNAYAYFACPLAVRRRLPWVIKVVVKPEFATPEGMLDSAKATCEAGHYPDFWVWHVQRVKPAGDQPRKRDAILEEVAVYDNVLQFIRWFNETTRSFREIQEMVVTKQEEFASLTLCEHGIPSSLCEEVHMQASAGPVPAQHPIDMDSWIEMETHRRLQRGSTLAPNAIRWIVNREFAEYPWYRQLYERFTAAIFVRILMFYMHLYTFRPFMFMVTYALLRFLGPYSNICAFIFSYFSYRCVNNARVWEGIGSRIRWSPKIKKIAAITAASLITISSAYSLYKVVAKWQEKKDKKNKLRNLNQGGISSTIGRCPKDTNDTEQNVWQRDQYELSPLDLTPQITSIKQLDLPFLLNKIRNNLVVFKFLYEKENNKMYRITRALGLCGFEYLFNTHSLPSGDDEHWRLEITFKSTTELLNNSICIPLRRSMIRDLPFTDMSIVTIREMAPCANIIKYLPESTLRGTHTGVLIQRTESGSIHQRKVDNINFTEKAKTPLGDNVDLWVGYTYEPTVAGDCGSVLCIKTQMGPAIAGIHVLGGPSGEVCSLVLHQGIRSLLTTKVSAGEPVLNTPSTNRVLGDLHTKSVVRFVQDGQAIVYGSFEGFRGKHKSAVCETVIAPLMVERGYKIEHGAPIMNGWEPWRRAFLASTKREFNFDPDILKEARDGYLRDVLERLPEEELSLIEVYDDMTAINGVPGVKYVDKMKRNTSAGNPWKKSKKHLMNPLSFVNAEIEGMYIDEKYDILSSIMYDDAVIFDEEVMARVDDCILKYHAGERYCPVFCAHLKDEATSFKKIAIAKTRVFSGAPTDWSIVVRKYLLSVVRVMQRNKLVFECAPGTVAQSQEWELFYNYLTQFGEDQIVAGDYKEFDKSMQANLILMAFDILIELCKRAYYTEKDLMVLEGIALDTAYAFMDFNGDLVQFFGQNPSGHPLTVIINCIVNSIYLRYAYIKLNPQKEVRSFRKNVAPLTYGDDNIMGISKLIPWYNHTTISDVFSKVGLGYTMADKEAESVPYIHISEATFLKRSWRWDEDMQTHVCPIEHDSINRSLTVCVKSKTLCPEAQAIEVIGSAHREYFFYGKKIFEEKERMLREVVQIAGLQLYITDATFQTWDALKEKWFSYKVNVDKIV